MDPIFFFNSCLWTYDPRSEDKHLPFITYPYQDDFIAWAVERIDSPEDFLVDKSRDMGLSWMMYGIILWKWLFHKGFSSLIGSYIEDLVDNKTMDCHFGRLRYLIRRLPEWLYSAKDDASVNIYMRLENRENGNMIVGYAPTDKFSRQGRYSLAWADEFAFWDKGRSAWTAMGDATKCRAATSTPNGKGNKFADLALKSNIKKMTLHWRLHPNKTQQWYEAECERRTEEEVAQELDINYNKSVKGRVYPEFCERNYLEFEDYKPTQPLYVAWDFGTTTGNAMALLWIQIDKTDNTVRVIDAYQKEGVTVDFFIPFITGIVKSRPGVPGYQYDDNELHKILKHKNWQAAIHVGDPTGNTTDRGRGTSHIQDLRKENIIVNVNYKEFDLKTRITKTKLLIRRLLVNKDLLDFIDAMEQCRYPDRGENSQSTSPIDKPIHDWTSHYRTALEYYATNEQIKGDGKATVLPKDAESFDQRLKEIERSSRFKKFSTPSYRRAC